ncbi:transporter substrate-binding domain-containing protein [Rhizobium sp. CF142]|uniref:transporter substrate-binding domain-containing protein n=1 Tax=Rhizobium sp. CF142 TaxID=1144314 RepID=UPI00026EFF2D|nr:transporter substrate-binding domain-containing protein [Rhizobium sp. CF142]EJJ28089.1 periplasmic component of amino acid ABC-type transporter/signal transduction system [Rhizobium sp. CF142]
MLKTLLALGVVGAMLTAQTMPAMADTYANIISAKKIRVSTDLAIPPSGMLDANLKPVGSDVETAQLLAKDWGVDVEFVQTTGATRIPNLQTNKADIVISTLSVTPERAQVIDFSKPYAGLLSVIAAPASSPIKDWADLKGQTVTVTRGTTQDSELTKMASEHGFTVARYDDDATMVTAAVSGQAKAIATSATLVKQVHDKNPTLAFEPKITIRVLNLAIGVRKNEPELLAKVNDWVAANLKNGKLNDIYQKYHGTPLPAEIVNAQ